MKRWNDEEFGHIVTLGATVGDFNTSKYTYLSEGLLVPSTFHFLLVESSAEFPAPAQSEWMECVSDMGLQCSCTAS